MEQYANISATRSSFRYPIVFLAFLESDIVHRSSYWDVVTDASNSDNGSNTWKIIQIDEETKRRYDDYADEIRNTIAKSMGSTINRSSFALNALSTNATNVHEAKSRNPESNDIDIDVSMSNNEDQEPEPASKAIPIQVAKPPKKLSFSTNIIHRFMTDKASSDNATMPLQKLLELPGILLDELVSLLKLINANNLFQVNENYLKETTCNLSSDFLPNRYTLLLNCRGKSHWNDGILHYNWLSQYRIQAVLLPTTAFKDISRRIELLQQIPLKDLASVSETIRVAFLLNLYNLLSLHTSLLIPWPSTSNHHQRLLWQSQYARYKVGANFLSLFQIEYGLLRGQKISLDMSIHKDANDSTVIDMKPFQNLALADIDPRVQFALCKPHRSSSRISTSFTYKNLKRMLFESVSSYFVKINASNNHLFRLPKFMRYFSNDYVNYVPPVPSAMVQRPVSATVESDQTKIVEDSSVIVNDWDIAQITTKDHLATSTIPIDRYESSPPTSSNLRIEMILDDSYGGDVDVTDIELQRILRILQLGLDVRDRRIMLRTIKSCFLGR